MSDADARERCAPAEPAEVTDGLGTLPEGELERYNQPAERPTPVTRPFNYCVGPSGNPTHSVASGLFPYYVI